MRGKSETNGAAPDDPLAREVVCLLSHMGEALATAPEKIAGGEAAGSTSVLQSMLQADAHLTEAVRLVPEEQFNAAVRGLWGGDAVRVRLR